MRINLSYSYQTNFFFALNCSSRATCSCQKLSFARPTSQAILFSTLSIRLSYSLILSLDQEIDCFRVYSAFLLQSYKLPFSLKTVASFSSISSIRERALLYHPCIFQASAFSLWVSSSTICFSFCLVLSNFLWQKPSISAAQAWNLTLHSSPTLTFILCASNSRNLVTSFSYHLFSSSPLFLTTCGAALSCSTLLNSKSISVNFCQRDICPLSSSVCISELRKHGPEPADFEKRQSKMVWESLSEAKFKSYLSYVRSRSFSSYPLSAQKTEEAKTHPILSRCSLIVDTTILCRKTSLPAFGASAGCCNLSASLARRCFLSSSLRPISLMTVLRVCLVCSSSFIV